MSLSARRGGDPDGPMLVLLHGLGGTGAVWDRLVTHLDPVWHWMAPDLPGHGGSPRRPGYSFGGMAADVADLLDRGRPVAVLGHSLGGAVGLALASGWFGVRVAAVCGLGIKVRWPDADLVKAAEMAARPNRVFTERAEAVDRALKIAGLAGLMEPGDAAAQAGVVEAAGGWTIALDPLAFAVGAPDMRGLLDAARADVVLAAGEFDRMGPPEHLRELQTEPVVLTGLGHNAHVEHPAALAPILRRLRTALG